MEIKWLMISFAVVMGTLGIADAVRMYQTGQCRIEAIKAQVPAEKINLSCGIK